MRLLWFIKYEMLNETLEITIFAFRRNVACLRKETLLIFSQTDLRRLMRLICPCLFMSRVTQQITLFFTRGSKFYGRGRMSLFFLSFLQKWERTLYQTSFFFVLFSAYSAIREQRKIKFLAYCLID